MIVAGAPCLRAADDDSDSELWRFPVSSAWLAQRRLVLWRLSAKMLRPRSPLVIGARPGAGIPPKLGGRGSRGGAAVHGEESDEAHS